jgi:uncharacterized integral membrane protein
MSELPSHEPAPVDHKWRPSPKLIGATVVAVLALVLALQNTRRTRIDIYFWTVRAPLWIWLIIIFVAGLVVGSVFPWFRRSKRRRADAE